MFSHTFQLLFDIHPNDYFLELSTIYTKLFLFDEMTVKTAENHVSYDSEYDVCINCGPFTNKKCLSEQKKFQASEI